MRRWPRSHERALSKGIEDIEDDDVEHYWEGIAQSDYNQFLGGKAIDITRASIYIQGQNEEKKGLDEDVKSSFNLPLKKGLCELKAAFGNDENKELLAPYFIYVKRLDYVVKP